MPNFPVTEAIFKTWVRNFNTKSSTTGAHLFISKGVRIAKPSRKIKIDSEGFTKKELSAIFQKKYKAWAKRDQQILLALREIASNSKHFISCEFDRFTSGVEVYHFLMTKMSPATADPTSSNKDAIERLTNLKLISVKQEGFMKFLSLFQETVFDLEETGAFVPSPDYQKSLLISKLPLEYHSITILSATKLDWDQYVAHLMAFSVAIEKKDTKSYKDALNSNVNSGSGRKLVDSILGIPITDKGLSLPSSRPTCPKTRRLSYSLRSGH